MMLIRIIYLQLLYRIAGEINCNLQLNKFVLFYNVSAHKINGILSQVRYSVGKFFKGESYKYKAKTFLRERSLFVLELGYDNKKGVAIRAIAVAEDLRGRPVISKIFL